jgi:hypothetical protein
MAYCLYSKRIPSPLFCEPYAVFSTPLNKVRLRRGTQGRPARCSQQFERAQSGQPPAAVVGGRAQRRVSGVGRRPAERERGLQQRHAKPQRGRARQPQRRRGVAHEGERSGRALARLLRRRSRCQRCARNHFSSTAQTGSSSARRKSVRRETLALSILPAGGLRGRGGSNFICYLIFKRRAICAVLWFLFWCCCCCCGSCLARAPAAQPGALRPRPHGPRALGLGHGPQRHPAQRDAGRDRG